MNFDGFNCRTASSTIYNNIDVSIEVKMYSETSFRLFKGDFRLHSDSQKRLRQLYEVQEMIIIVFLYCGITQEHTPRLEYTSGVLCRS